MKLILIKSALALYFFLTIYIIFQYRFSLRFSYLFPLLLPFLIYSKKSLSALLDWSPVYIAILSHDTMRSYADNLSGRISNLPYKLEVLIFGDPVPNVIFQNKFANYINSPLSYILLFSYLSHFFVPIFFLYYLWKKNIVYFQFTVTALLILYLLSVISFVLLPASPPWHSITEIQRITPLKLNELFGITNEFHSLDANPYAPFPSLHAGLPFLFSLLSTKFMPKAKYLLILLFTIVSFTLVLFGEHFIVDIVAGTVYATGSYAATTFLKKKNALFPLLRYN